MSPRYSQHVSRTSNLYSATCVRRHICIRIQVASPGHVFPGDMCPGVDAALDPSSSTVPRHNPTARKQQTIKPKNRQSQYAFIPSSRASVLNSDVLFNPLSYCD